MLDIPAQNLNPQSLSRFASCLQGIAGLLECPVCLEVIHPPSWQCCHGHLICSGCRAKSTKCPICRVMLGRGRCIVADKLFAFLVQTLGQHEGEFKLRYPSILVSSIRVKSYFNQSSHSSHTFNSNCTDTLNDLSFAGESRPVAQKSSNLQSVNARLPLFARDRALCKQSSKLKANPSGALAMTGQQIAKVTSAALAPASSVPLQYCCPSGQPCGKMKNQHDILIHLQKSHQTSVVQYYATVGDTLSIKFNESCVTCVVLIPSATGTACDENNNNCNSSGDQRPVSNDNCTKSGGKTITEASHAELGEDVFFIAKFRCMEASSQALYWLWYLGGEDRLGRFKVNLSAEHGGPTRWCGRPVSLQKNCKEVLKTKQFVRMDYGAKELQVLIDVKR